MSIKRNEAEPRPELHQDSQNTPSGRSLLNRRGPLDGIQIRLSGHRDKVSASAHQEPGNNFFSTSPYPILSIHQSLHRSLHRSLNQFLQPPWPCRPCARNRRISGPHSVPNLHEPHVPWVRIIIGFWPQPVSPSIRHAGSLIWDHCEGCTSRKGLLPFSATARKVRLRIEYQLGRLSSSSTDLD
jgi:hypothetical protein